MSIFDFNTQIMTQTDKAMLDYIVKAGKKELDEINAKRIKEGLKPKKYIVTKIPFNLIRIDYRYQRPLDTKRFNAIIANYDINKVKVKFGSVRNTGIFLPDGNMTAHALHAKGEEGIEIKLFFDLTPEEEAVYFANQFEHETKPRKTQQFKALLFAQDPQAVAINDIVHEYGCTLLFPGDKPTEGKNIKAVTLLDAIYLSYGEEGVRLGFELFKQAGWIKYNESFKHVYLSMMKNINQTLKYLEGKDKDKAYKAVLAVMKKNRPSAFLGLAHTAASFGDEQANMHTDERALREYTKILAGVN